MSYSGRLVKTDGSPVVSTASGPDLRFRLSYSGSPTTYLCTINVDDVPLTNGVFHVKLDFTPADCVGGKSLARILNETPSGQSLGIQVSDLTTGRDYGHQAYHSIPSAIVAQNLAPNGATDGQYLRWSNATKTWVPATGSGGGGALNDLVAGAGIDVASVDGDTWSVAIANLGVGTAQLANGAVTDAKLGTNISRSKLANGTPNYVLVNNGAGGMGEVAFISLSQGGTGATTAAGARTNLGLGTAATANVGYAAGNVFPGDGIPVCAPGEVVTHQAGPIFFACVSNATADGTKVAKAGDTMTGALVLSGAPTLDLHAATKKYVDDTTAASTLWSTDGTHAWRGSGRVGIGTTTPTTKLDVVGGDNEFITFRSGTRAISIGQFAGEANIYWGSGTDLTFASGSEKMRITSDGKLGLGTASPKAMIDLTSTTSGILIPRMTTAERDAIVTVPATAITGMQIYNTSTNELNFHNGTSWQAVGVSGAGVTSITAGSGLSGGTITASGTIAVAANGITSTHLDTNAVTTSKINDGAITNAKISAIAGIQRTKIANGSPNHVVINDGSGVLSSIAALPPGLGGTGLNAVGASNQVLGMNNAGTAMEYKTITAGTNVSLVNAAGSLTINVADTAPSGAAGGDLSGTYPNPTLNTVPVSKGGTGVTSLTARGVLSANDSGNGVVSTTCTVNQLLSFDASGNPVCANPGAALGNPFVQDGNSFGATATLGTNDANALVFETNNAARMTILSSGRVGIGSSSPSYPLDVTIPNGEYMAARFKGSSWHDSLVQIEAGGTGGRVGISYFVPGVTSFMTYLNPTGDKFYFNPGNNMNSPSSNSMVMDVATGNIGIRKANPGAALDVSGQIRMSGSTSGYAGFQAAATAGSTIWTLPTADGANGQVLKTNGSGVLSWETLSTSATPSGAAGGDLSGTYPNPTITGLSASKVGSGTVDNTEFSYLDGVTSSVQTQLNAKEGTLAAGTSAQYYRGDKTWQTLDTAAVAEHSSNLYFLDSRVRATLMSGYAAGGAFPLAATDTLLEALGKLEGQIIANKATVDGSALWSNNSGNAYRTGGSVGIGTSVPYGHLAVSSGGAEGIEFYPANFAGGSAIQFYNRSNSTYNVARFLASEYRFDTIGGVEKMRITSAGNVGIGISTPSFPLEVAGNIKSSAGSGDKTGITIGSNGSELPTLEFNASDNSKRFWFQMNGVNTTSERLSFYGGPQGNVGSIEMLTLSGNGRVGIGTVSPQSKFDVHRTESSGTLHTVARFGLTDTNSSAYRFLNVNLPMDGQHGMGFSWNTGSRFDFTPESGTPALSITNTGAIGVGSTIPGEKLEVNGNVKAISFISTSDRRLKTNLKKVSGLETLEKITGYRFDWKDSGKTEYGVMAQDVEKVMPEAVVTNKVTGVKAVKYDGLFAPVIQAVKELYEHVTGQDKKIEKLNREIASLKEREKKLEERLERLEKAQTAKKP